MRIRNLDSAKFDFLKFLPAFAFLFFAVTLALFLAMLVPLGQGPDETAHVARAASLLSGQIIGRRAPMLWQGNARSVAGIDVDRGLLEVTDQTLGGASDKKLRLDYYERAQHQPWSDRIFVAAPNAAVYMPAFYVPAAVGLAVGRLRGAGPFAAVRTARLANVAAFAILSICTLLIARHGKWLLFCVLTLPMSLFLASVANQDSLIIAASALAAALMSRLDREEAGGIHGRWQYGAAALILSLIICAKPVYAPLAVMLFFPPYATDARGRLKTICFRFGVACLVLTPAVLWTAYMQAFLATPPRLSATVYTPGPLWPGSPTVTFDSSDTGAQMEVLRADWREIFILPWRTMTNDVWLVRQAIGVLGWLDVVLTPALYRIWYVALGGATFLGLMTSGPGRASGGWMRSIAAVPAVFATVVLVYLSQYLSWTLVGSDHVDGVQGRYFLPIIPLIAISLPSVGWWRVRLARTALVFVSLSAAVYQMIALPIIIVEAWYLR